MTGPDVVDCATCREHISAALDGEDDPGRADVVERHLAHCAGCTAWRSRAARVTRLVRTVPVRTGPDVTAAVLDRVTLPRRRDRAGGWRVALGGVGAVQLVLAVLALLGTGTHAGHAPPGDPSMMGAGMIHMSHESVAWNLALGAALLTGAVRPRLLAGLLPGLGVFLGVLTVLSAVDVVAGRVDLERLATHLVLVLGFVLGVIVSRRARRDGDPEPTAGHGPRRTPWPRGRARTSGRAAGPRGTATRRRDAA